MYARSRSTKLNAGALAGRWFAAALAAFTLVACDETPVTLPTPTEIVIGGEAFTMYAGDNIEIAARVVDQDGQVMSGEYPTWTSSNGSVAPVGSQGAGEARVYGESPGEATLTASYGGLTAQATVTVIDDDRDLIRSFAFAHDTIDSHVNETSRTVSYLAFDGYGDRECVSNDLYLTSSDESVATVFATSCDVVITFVGPGTATITGDVDGATGQMVVNLTDQGPTAYFLDEAFAPGPGDVITYEVKVADPTGAAKTDHTVNFSATGGTLEATSVTTDDDGVASVDWTAPTNLTDLGQDFDIRFRTMISPDSVATQVISEFVSTGTSDHVTFHIWDADAGKWEGIGGDTIQLVLDEERTIVANLRDEYGNLIETDGTITSSDGGVVNASGTNATVEEGQLSSDSPFIDIESAAETTVTLTADLDDDGEDGLMKDLVVEFITP